MRILIKILKIMYGLPLTRLRAILISLIGKLEGGQAFSKTIRQLMERYHGIKIGIGTYGPCFNLDQTWVGKGNLTVGNYTSIAKGVCIYTRNHPYEKPSTSPIFYSAAFSTWNQLAEDAVSYGKLSIGNDVWIGQYAVILPSCHKIGDGAVIGAGSIITKDIPDYAVVVGNPGRIIKYRFDDDTIKYLQKTQWWLKEPQELMKQKNLFVNMKEFTSKFE